MGFGKDVRVCGDEVRCLADGSLSHLSGNISAIDVRGNAYSSRYDPSLVLQSLVRDSRKPCRYAKRQPQALHHNSSLLCISIVLPTYILSPVNYQIRELLKFRQTRLIRAALHYTLQLLPQLL